MSLFLYDFEHARTSVLTYLRLDMSKWAGPCGWNEIVMYLGRFFDSYLQITGV